MKVISNLKNGTTCEDLSKVAVPAETFVTSSGTTIIIHRPKLTTEEREERMKEIEESASRLLMKRKGKK